MIRSFLGQLPAADRAGLSELFIGLARHPQRLAQLQERYWQEQARLWAEALHATRDADPSGMSMDRRFEAREWHELPFFRLLKDSYQLNTRWLGEFIEAAELAPPVRDRVAFLVGQLNDAIAPTNFPATNPEVIRLAVHSGGESLAKGLHNLQADLARGRISMSDETAFEVGRNVAVTPGAVVYENELVQLIQYAAPGPRVYTTPLLIVPPFINKYYILDLQPHNSFVRFALEQGLQVFMISWRNVPAELGRLGWDDYVRQGVLAALDVVLEVSRSRALHVLGFCVGGTLLASALAVMDEPSRVASLTLLAALLDFSDVGDIGVYVDESYVNECERAYANGGVVAGARIAASFASLRANELVWHFVVNNYLKGSAPPAFDLLFWNSDAANLPGPLYAWYLRNMYLENRLRSPGELRVLNRPIDLGRLRMPAYLFAAHDDHIVPWRSAYASTHLLAGKIEFVLGASGHIAGVVNPPVHKRRHYWRNPDLAQAASAWLEGAQRTEGSWWGHWAQWIRAHSGEDCPAPPALGSAAHGPIEPAPGRYVRERAEAAGDLILQQPRT